MTSPTREGGGEGGGGGDSVGLGGSGGSGGSVAAPLDLLTDRLLGGVGVDAAGLFPPGIGHGGVNTRAAASSVWRARQR